MASQATKPDQPRRRCDTALRALGSRAHGRRRSGSASTLAACHAAALSPARLRRDEAIQRGHRRQRRALPLRGGRLGGKVSGPVLLLDHTGRKSGRRRTTPVLYIQDRDDLVVVGSARAPTSTPPVAQPQGEPGDHRPGPLPAPPSRRAPGDARGRRSGCGRAWSTPAPTTRFTSGERSARSR
jgi:F420H(2)-dependent quinone reductase